MISWRTHFATLLAIIFFALAMMAQGPDSTSSDPARPLPAPPAANGTVTLRGDAQQAQSNRQANQVFPDSRVDLYGGYAAIWPNTLVNGIELKAIYHGGVSSVTYYLDHYLGLQAEGGFHPDGKNDCIYSAQGGPVVRFPQRRLIPWLHVVLGGEKIGGPNFQPCTWGYGFAAGGGLDLPFAQHFAWRIVQADFVYGHVNFGTPDNLGLVGGKADMNGGRLSTGLVVRLGSLVPPTPVTLSCTAHPAEVYPGDPVQVTATPANLPPKKTPVYTWNTNAGVLSGTGETVNVNTKGVAPGSYRVSGHMSIGKKPWQMADCSANFIVKPFPPPTITCSPNPSTIKPGEHSTITAKGNSAVNRPLTYSYKTSAGHIEGSGSQVTLDPGDVATGQIDVTCTVTDDLGKSGNAIARVTVEAPPVEAPKGPPPTQALCSIMFEKDKRRPARVDNEAKACLDDVATTMAHQPDANLVIIGEAAEKEKNGKKLASERAVNTKGYLTKEKGIAPNRIQVVTGPDKGKQAENILVPPNAQFDTTGTEPIDESKMAAPAPRKHKATPKPPAE